jgi:uncharacterized RDD family membrane protein YckC
MNCVSCHTQNRDAARFCSGCGSDLILAAAAHDASLYAGVGSESAGAGRGLPVLPNLLNAGMVIGGAMLCMAWKSQWVGFLHYFVRRPIDTFRYSFFWTVGMVISLAVTIVFIGVGGARLLGRRLPAVTTFAAAGAGLVGVAMVAISAVVDWEPDGLWQLFGGSTPLTQFVGGVAATASSGVLLLMVLNPSVLPALVLSPSRVAVSVRVPINQPVYTSAPGYAPVPVRPAVSPSVNPYAIQTPQRGVLAAGYVCASIGQRWTGSFVDGLVNGLSSLMAFVVLTAILAAGGNGGNVILVPIALCLFLFPFWNIVMRQGAKGKSIGKSSAGTMIIRQDGLPVSRLTMFGRVLLTMLFHVVCFPFGSLIDIIMVLAGQHRQRMADKMLNLVVVKAPQPEPVYRQFPISVTDQLT